MKGGQKYAFMIAAPRSNSGKTLATLGLMRALIKKGFDVQPFKCGPDYIDPMHHKVVSGKASYNLDVWMSDSDHVKSVFPSAMQDGEIAIVEGVMGLFDGAVKDRGSSAEIAQLLSIPIVLVVDASSMAYSVAPLLYGFKNFNPGIRLAGVIFNKTGSEAHVHILEESTKDAGVEMLGFIPRDERLAIGSRHLGLHLPEENEDQGIVDVAAELIEKHVFLDRLMEVCRLDPLDQKEQLAIPDKKPKITFAVAQDRAFSFTYQANLDALSRLGIIVFFSPMNDATVPEADLVWLPGGYPELFGEELSSNASMIHSIRSFIGAGMPVIAECGGMMYLGKSIIDKYGNVCEVVGVFDFSTSFEKMKLHLGYRELALGDSKIKGHEFHYSELVWNNEAPADTDVRSARGLAVNMPVFRHKNCWASYMHLYLGEPQKMLNFLNYLRNSE